MPLHLGLPHSHQRGGQQDAMREARRQLAERLRNDWNYPSLPQPQQPESASEDVASIRALAEAHLTVSGPAQTVSPAHLEELDFEPVGWCERTYSSVDSAESEQSASESKAAVTSSSYKYESPDDIGAVLAARGTQRKQQRQQRLQEEMEWNAGLAHFVARRNAWTGARVAETDTDTHEGANRRERKTVRERTSPAHPSTTASVPSDPNAHQSEYVRGDLL
ncbi:hypothetical protein H2203_006840 [Taxawa tesnikishii (nom. ined.)]|nr:hypothetical protein H2203_006840 [Dothideales sp. JES 119]